MCIRDSAWADHEHYQYKLRWMAQLRAHVAALSSPDEQVVVTGDFNIAPTDLDVYDLSLIHI